jgi:hypothetical protein
LEEREREDVARNWTISELERVQEVSRLRSEELEGRIEETVGELVSGWSVRESEREKLLEMRISRSNETIGKERREREKQVAKLLLRQLETEESLELLNRTEREEHRALEEQLFWRHDELLTMMNKTDQRREREGLKRWSSARDRLDEVETAARSNISESAARVASLESKHERDMALILSTHQNQLSVQLRSVSKVRESVFNLSTQQDAHANVQASIAHSIDQVESSTQTSLLEIRSSAQLLAQRVGVMEQDVSLDGTWRMEVGRRQGLSMILFFFFNYFYYFCFVLLTFDETLLQQRLL